MLCDPELIHRLLVTDFEYFTDHGLFVDSPDDNPLINNLFNMKGEQWKIMRTKLTPVFTPSKIGHMYDQIDGCSKQMIHNMIDKIEAGQGCIEVRDVLDAFSTDVIGTCAFGLQMNAIDDKSSEFRKHGKIVFMPNIMVMIRELSSLISPTFRKMLKIRDIPKDTVQFFIEVFTSTMKYRETNNVIRNDLVQSLMQARMDLVVNKKESSGIIEYNTNI